MCGDASGDHNILHESIHECHCCKHHEHLPLAKRDLRCIAAHLSCVKECDTPLDCGCKDFIQLCLHCKKPLDSASCMAFILQCMGTAWIFKPGCIGKLLLYNKSLENLVWREWWTGEMDCHLVILFAIATLCVTPLQGANAQG